MESHVASWGENSMTSRCWDVGLRYSTMGSSGQSYHSDSLCTTLAPLVTPPPRSHPFHPTQSEHIETLPTNLITVGSQSTYHI